MRPASQRKPIQLTDSTLCMLIVEEVRKAEVLRKDPPEQLAIPLDANLDEEAGEDEMVAALFRNVDASRAKEKETRAANTKAPPVIGSTVSFKRYGGNNLSVTINKC